MFPACFRIDPDSPRTAFVIGAVPDLVKAQISGLDRNVPQRGVSATTMDERTDRHRFLPEAASRTEN
jgi:hypothetical protein